MNVKGLCACLIIVFYDIAIVLSDDHNVRTTVQGGKKTYLDVLIDDVERAGWREDEVPCYRQTLAVLTNARNLTLWAIWALDSIQLPVGVLYGSKYQLGNYDECMKAPWVNSHPDLRTQYCLADVGLSGSKPRQKRGDFDPNGSAKSYINTLTKHRRQLSTVTWGVCMPAVCQPRSVAKFLRILFLNSHLAPLTSNPSITVESCQVAGTPHQYSTGFYIFMMVILTLFVIAITSTYYVAEKDHASSSSIVTDVAKAFCMRRNAYDLVKENRDELHVMHGMRALTACIMVYVHQMYYLNSVAVSNGLDVDKDIDFVFPVLHVDLLTDTFFMMSGLLIAKGFMDKCGEPENPFLLLLKRYFRLIGPFALVVGYMSLVSGHAGAGPLWPRLAGLEQRTCVDNWWRSLLMMNNYVNSAEICYLVSWYIPIDYHLAVLSTALFYIFRRDRRAGVVAFAAVTILSMLLPGLLTYRDNLPAVPLFNVETMVDVRAILTSSYMWSHHRAGPYLVGLAFGYFISVFKPDHYRNTVSPKLSWLSFVVGFAIAWVLLILGGIFYTRDYSALEAAIFAGTNRVVWAIAIGVLILLCEYGTVPIIKAFLSWSVFVPLSRLSYGMYLAHPAVIQRNVFTARAPLRQDLFTLLIDSFGAVVCGYIVSLLIQLLVQAPIINLTNLVLSSKVKSRPKLNGEYNEQKQKNGLNGSKKSI